VRVRVLDAFVLRLFLLFTLERVFTTVSRGLIIRVCANSHRIGRGLDVVTGEGDALPQPKTRPHPAAHLQLVDADHRRMTVCLPLCYHPCGRRAARSEIPDRFGANDAVRVLPPKPPSLVDQGRAARECAG
jgi:hypothetical protein